MHARSLVARRASRAARAQLLDDLERRAELAQLPATPKSPTPDDCQRAHSLSVVREQLSKLSSMISRERAAVRLERLCRVQRELLSQERDLVNPPVSRGSRSSGEAVAAGGGAAVEYRPGLVAAGLSVKVKPVSK
jgi:hypothetical protein